MTPEQIEQLLKDGKLNALILDEMSGVDRGANGWMGWMVLQKQLKREGETFSIDDAIAWVQGRERTSKQGGSMDTTKEQIAHVLQKAAQIDSEAQAAVAALQSGIFTEAPENVQRAAQVVSEYAQSLMVEADGGATSDDDGKDKAGNVFVRALQTLTGIGGGDTGDEGGEAEWDGLVSAYASGADLGEVTAKLEN